MGRHARCQLTNKEPEALSEDASQTHSLKKTKEKKKKKKKKKKSPSRS